MGLRQFFCTSGNLKKTLVLNPSIENYSIVPGLGMNIYYPLPLTLVRGYKFVINWALAPIFF